MKSVYSHDKHTVVKTEFTWLHKIQKFNREAHGTRLKDHRIKAKQFQQWPVAETGIYVPIQDAGLAKELKVRLPMQPHIPHDALKCIFWSHVAQRHDNLEDIA